MERGPRNFRLVDFDNPATWRNVPMHEWSKVRAEISEKIRMQNEDGKGDEYLAVQFAAFQQMQAEEMEHDRCLRSRLTDRQVRRLQQLTKQGLKERGLKTPLLTYWEARFVRKTAWLDRIDRAFDGNGEDDKLICVLASWCHGTDKRLESALNPNLTTYRTHIHRN